MSKVRVKICGITSLKDLSTAVEAGADAIGFIVDVPSSPRNLSIRDAEKLMEATPIFVSRVVVTVPKDLSRLKRIYEKLNPEIIQLHGAIHMCKEIREQLPDACLIGAIQMKQNINLDVAVKTAEKFDAILLDSHSSGKYGGTGRTHDWMLSRRIRDAIYPKPLILAGGLNPENVKDAIRIVRPYAVDVSSGVESHPGVKDREKTFRFMRNAKEAEI